MQKRMNVCKQLFQSNSNHKFTVLNKIQLIGTAALKHVCIFVLFPDNIFQYRSFLVVMYISVDFNK